MIFNTIGGSYSNYSFFMKIILFNSKQIAYQDEISHISFQAFSNMNTVKKNFAAVFQLTSGFDFASFAEKILYTLLIYAK